jgi:transcriptional regulator with GAF, ATPase, and Fis domain
MKGSFTGAYRDKPGKLELADSGTVFLDEIGEMTLRMQGLLLRFLETGELQKVGADRALGIVDVRVISATNRDLRTMVNVGAFREDLYFRLAVLPVSMPPLRDRPEDIPALVRHFMGARGEPTPALLRELASRPWLGNVRELRNFVERACALGTAEALAIAGRSERPGPVAGATPSIRGLVPDIPLDQGLRDFREQWMERGERDYLRTLLERTSRDIPAAAQAAGVDRTYIYRLIRKHGL